MVQWCMTVTLMIHQFLLVLPSADVNDNTKQPLKKRKKPMSSKPAGPDDLHHSMRPSGGGVPGGEIIQTTERTSSMPSVEDISATISKAVIKTEPGLQGWWTTVIFLLPGYFKWRS